MNKQVLEYVESEIRRTEDVIERENVKLEQLDVVRRNLKEYLSGSSESVDIVRRRPGKLPPKGRKVACPVCGKKVHKQGYFPHLRSMHPTYKEVADWKQKFGKAPVATANPKRKYEKKVLHWTQRPENKARVEKWMKKMTATRKKQERASYHTNLKAA